MTDLVQEIVTALSVEPFYRVEVPEGDEGRVEEVRRAGREAGRFMARPVRTWTSKNDPTGVYVEIPREHYTDAEREALDMRQRTFIDARGKKWKQNG